MLPRCSLFPEIHAHIEASLSEFIHSHQSSGTSEGRKNITWKKSLGLRASSLRHTPNTNIDLARSQWLAPSCARSNRKRHLIVEAGTGTGKTLAYLVPAVAAL
jgi:Rad3-related DNA helicase